MQDTNLEKQNNNFVKALEKYLEKQKSFSPSIQHPVDQNVGISVVIPCYNEPGLDLTLEHLSRCQVTGCKVEVLVVMNASADDNEEVIRQNEQSTRLVNTFDREKGNHFIRFYPIEKTNIPPKHAGVGFARKTGMDETISRYSRASNPRGIIVSLDADTLCAENYLVEIEQFFKKNTKAVGCNIHFEHPLEGNDFPAEIYQGICLHELYLRYHVEGLRYSKFPYAFHTVGSCFAVRASTYALQGGMNKKQGGEDFYFLQKIFPLGNFHELKTTVVKPSPRVSLRVPFGTGPVMAKIIQENELLVYDPVCFEQLKQFFTIMPEFYKRGTPFIEQSIDILPRGIKDFLEQSGYQHAISEINQNTASQASFQHRFFNWFDAFRIIKYLNFCSEKYLPKKPVNQMAELMLKKLGHTHLPTTPRELLQVYRHIQQQGRDL